MIPSKPPDRAAFSQYGMQIVPIIRYLCIVGPLLLSLLFLFGAPDKPGSTPAPGYWSSVDSLRAMAHLGEPVQGLARNARFVWTERAPPEPAASTNPVIMNAQANMDSQRTAGPPAAKPRKPKLATRQIRVRTAVAENAQRMPLDVFRPPSW